MHDIYGGIGFGTSFMEFVFSNQPIIMYVETSYICMFTQCLEIVINFL